MRMRPLLVPAVLAAATVLVGCGRMSTPKTTDAAPAAARPEAKSTTATADSMAAAPTAADAAAVEAILAKADAADGTVDKIVSKCAGCGLGMAGLPEHSADCHGYTLHLCSAHCKESYEKNGDAMITALPIN